MLLLSFMHMFGFKVLYGGQKMGILAVFLSNTNFPLRLTSNEYWIV